MQGSSCALRMAGCGRRGPSPVQHPTSAWPTLPCRCVPAAGPPLRPLPESRRCRRLYGFLTSGAAFLPQAGRPGW